jgi:hypothetical protein
MPGRLAETVSKLTQPKLLIYALLRSLSALA